MTVQLALFDAPAPVALATKRGKKLPAPPAALPGLFPPAAPAPKSPWPLTLTVNREQDYALLASEKAPFAAPLLERAAHNLGLPVRDGAVLITPVGYTPLGDIGGEFLRYLAQQHPERELQVWRTTVTISAAPPETPPTPAPAAPAPPQLDPRTLTAPRSRATSTDLSTKLPTEPSKTATEPPSKLAALAQANPGHIFVVRPAPVAPEPCAPPITRAARHTWPVNFTVYANGQTVITCAEWSLELFRQTATRHNYLTDGNAVVTVVQRVDAALPWTESNVRLDDQAEAFINALPYTARHWYFEFVNCALPEQYTPARLAEPDEATSGDHIYTIDFEDTRADLLAAGDLVDITNTAYEAGFKLPIAVTRALWDIIEDIPPAHSYQSVRGRLWDLVSLAQLAVRQNPEASRVRFKLIMHHANRTYLNVVMTIGPGDATEPVITLMLPDEE